MRASAILVSALLCASWCQGASRLEGTVRDGSEAVVPQASILCVAEETGFRFETQSDREGNYAIALPDGSYNIIVRHPGFHSIARIGVLVPLSGALRLDFELMPSSIRETITVQDAPGTIPSAETGGTVLKPDELEALPRNDGAVTGLLAMVPGVLFTPASRGEPGQFSSVGARPNTNQFSVDGISGNNAVAGAGWPSFLPGVRLPAMTALGTTHGLAMLDSIQEVKVETQGEGSGAGLVQGANVMIHTRPGTNHLHGSLFFHGRPQMLGASDWFSNRYSLGHDAPSLDEEGGSLGGPLRRGRTFFFLAAERLALRQSYAWTTTVPSLLARTLSPASLLSLLNEFPKPNGPDLSLGISQLVGRSSMPAGLETVSIRIDHQFSERIRSFLRYADTPSWSNSGLTQIALSEYRSRMAAGGVTRTSGPWTHDIRLGYSRNQAASTWSHGRRRRGSNAGFLFSVPEPCRGFFEHRGWRRRNRVRRTGWPQSSEPLASFLHFVVANRAAPASLWARIS